MDPCPRIPIQNRFGLFSLVEEEIDEGNPRARVLEQMMMGGGGEGDVLGGRMGIVAGFPLQMMTPAASAAEMVGTSGGVGGSGGGQRGKEEKVPQWGQLETRELIAIRADLERDFTVSRRNKTLWEAVALRMREKGYRRTSDQSKCKWKNLVNRYKGKETADAESGRQCPFFEELHALFTERAKNMQRLLESESGTPLSKNKLKRLSGDRSSDELSDDDEDEEDSEEDRSARNKKKKAERSGLQQQARAGSEKSRTANSIHDLLQEFLQQQQQMEAHWWEMMDKRAQQRQRFEQEWKKTMEKLENERLMLEQAWREREEQRRMREESRAEKRDALLTTLLNKLIRDDL